MLIFKNTKIDTLEDHIRRNEMNGIIKKMPLVARIILGLLFLLSGIVGLFNLVPPPPDLPESMVTFMNGVMATKFMFPLIKGTEVVCGALLLSGFYVPLALIVLAPVVLNIFLINAFMAPSGLPIAIFIVLLQIYLSFFAKPYSDVVKQIFIKK